MLLEDFLAEVRDLGEDGYEKVLSLRNYYKCFSLFLYDCLRRKRRKGKLKLGSFDVKYCATLFQWWFCVSNGGVLMVNVLLHRIVAMPLVCPYWQKSGFECLKALAEIVW